jgi:predicted MPP superfamily phosphohydrolase
MQFFTFFAVVLVLTAFAWACVGAFVNDLIPGQWRTVVVAWALSVVPLFVLVRNLSTGRYPSALVRLLLFRLFWYSQLLMLALALASAVAFLVGLPFGVGAQAGRWMVIVGAVLLVALGVWGYVGSRRLSIRHLELAPPNMPKALEGLRIVQLSDLHVGPQTSRSQLARIAHATENAAPHLIAYTGDQVDDHPADIDYFSAAFSRLTAPLGVYAVAGNHDVYAGWSEVRARLEALGITVLVNDAVPLEHNGTRFWLAGTGDPAGTQLRRGHESGAPDVNKTLRSVPAGEFCLTLAHNPALFPALAQRKVDVVLSGHTHHGQFSIPKHGWSLASVFLEYAMGTYERNGSLLYVSPGTNFWGIPFRIGALPEVTVITLVARDNQLRT